MLRSALVHLTPDCTQQGLAAMTGMVLGAEFRTSVTRYTCKCQWHVHAVEAGDQNGMQQCVVLVIAD